MSPTESQSFHYQRLNKLCKLQYLVVGLCVFALSFTIRAGYMSPELNIVDLSAVALDLPPPREELDQSKEASSSPQKIQSNISGVSKVSSQLSELAPTTNASNRETASGCPIADPTKDEDEDRRLSQREEVITVKQKFQNDTECHTRVNLRQPKQWIRLSYDWSKVPPSQSFWAEAIVRHQSNCSLPVETLQIDNSFGIGSHFALWSQAICNAMERNVRLRTYNPDWLWMDKFECGVELSMKSPLLCYLPASEFRCDCGEEIPDANITDPRDLKKNQCQLLKKGREDLLHDFRAASTEYLFQQVSPVVIHEAERQVSLLFPNGTVPSDLITVHIRWGDKFWEMDLVTISNYTMAISELLTKTYGHNKTANIFLATEDPKAVDEFKTAIPSGWNVYYDLTIEELSSCRPDRGNRASHMAKNTNGKAGLVGIASLLVALEAKLFVLTTASNWSRLMNQLRKQIIDPQCGNCTKMIDLRQGIW